MSARTTLAAVTGFTVGHATLPAHGTGCTVVLGPAAGFRAAGVLRGRATGTREFDVLDPRHLVDRVDAIFLTGGSANGLGATDGVMRWLREQGRGLRVGPEAVVPIVPAAVIFDLGNAGKPAGWPAPDDGYRACTAASADIAEGRVGVGTGATVGKAAGIDKMMPAGLGMGAAHAGPLTVAALAVVNAVGDVRDARGEIIAGARGPDGAFLDSLRYLAEGGAPFGDASRLVRNTTLAVLATNANLTRLQLQELARAGSDALARRITPYGTQYDGDIVFAISTAAEPAPSPAQIEALAAMAVPQAIERAVRG